MPLSPQLVHERLQESARRLRLSRSGRHVLAGVAVSLFMMVAALLLDAQFHFGPTGRWISFAAIMLPWLVTAGFAFRIWRAPISEASVARRIEGVTSGSRNVLISAIQFDRELPPGSSLRQALFSEMNDPFPVVQWRDVFDIRLLQKLTLGLGFVVVALAAWAIVSPAHFTNSAARLLLPASKIAPLTRTRIVSIEPGNTQVIHGSNFSVTLKLGGEVPADAWVIFREAGAGWQKQTMNRQVGEPVFVYHWKEVTQPMEMYVVAGDAESARFKVAVRSKTAVKSKLAEIEPPAYAQVGPVTLKDFNGLQNILPGSRVAVTLTFNYPVAELTAVSEHNVPFTVTKLNDTDWRVARQTLGSEVVKLSYRDQDGNTAEDSFPIVIRPDDSPKIQVTDPVEGKQLVATHDATLAVTFTVTDDFGLGSVALYRSTAAAQAGELVQEWKDAEGLRSFTGNATVALRNFKTDDDGRLSFVVQAKDQNTVTGPGVTFSRPIVVTTQSPEQVQQQAEAAAGKLQKSLDELLKLQQTNLEETRGLVRAPEAGVGPALNRQVAIGEIGRQLAFSSDTLAATLRVTLQSLSQNEMKEAVLALRNASGATGATRAGALERAVDLEQVILARLQGAPDVVKNTLQAEQLKNVLSGVEELLRQQRDLHRDTKQAVEAAVAALADRQDALADESVRVRAELNKSAQNAPLADREFTGRLVQAAGMFGELKIYEDMLAAADRIQTKHLSDGAGMQVTVITNLTKIIGFLNEARLANAGTELDKLKDTLEGLKDKLAKLENIQRDVVEKSKDQARKDEFDAKDKATAQEIKETKDLMAKVIEQMMTDAHVLPDFKPANDLKSELVTIFEDVIQADKKEAEEGKLKASDIAVQKEDAILEALEKAKRIADDMEMWLPNKNETIKWLLENFDKSEMPNIPLLPLHDFFEDIVGNLLEEQQNLAEDANDPNSNQAFAQNEGNGWDIMDGPQPGFGAQGRSGNQRPNKNEQTGRSSGGRQGMSDGEMAGDTAKNLEGSEVDTRRTKDPMQKGQIKDEDGPSEAKATGGGKAGAFSDRQGMDGNAPLRGSNAPRQLAKDALAVEQALLKEKAAKTFAQASLLYLRANGMSDVVRLMDDSEKALKEGRFRDFNSIHQRIVQRLNAVKGGVASSDVVVLPTGESVRTAERQLAAGDEGTVPAQYKDQVADYYRSLTQER